MSSDVEQKLRGLVVSEKFGTAYSGISELAYGCYGKKEVGDRSFPVDDKGVPLTDENIEKVLNAPFDDDFDSLGEFKNFGEMLQHTVSVCHGDIHAREGRGCGSRCDRANFVEDRRLPLSCLRVAALSAEAKDPERRQ